MVSSIVRAVSAFHRNEAIHQEITPDNIIVDLHNKPTMMEFGSVKIAGITERQGGVSRNRLREQDQYIAPEYLLGKPVGHYSDLYSIGVLCYEMLTGHTPYGDEYASCRTAQQFSQLTYMPSYHYNPMVPLWMDGAIQQAVQINQQLRYQHLSEFVHDLKSPNPKFLSERDWIPLVERNPIGFWRAVSLASLVLNLLLAYKLIVS